MFLVKGILEVIYQITTFMIKKLKILMVFGSSSIIFFLFLVAKIKSKMVQMGFEPTPPKRLELESSALDRSATEPDRV